MTPKECRTIAYECAKKNNIKIPKSWETNKMAGKDWLMAFRRRHNLTLRKPEPCSLARATSFNRHNVDKFYNNLEKLINRHSAFADGTRIFNLDETSTNTVQKPPKIIAPKGKKCIGKVTSAERGTLVTTCCIICANGNALPPIMVFPRKKFKDHMIKNTPAGTLGLASPTGWMNSTLFPDVIKHFIKHTNSSKKNPAILIMDNHESHLCIEALDLAKEAGVHVLTLHPHTSGKLQPLDVGIYGPFKVYYNSAIDSWLMRNPGKPVTIYDVGELVGTAFQKAMTPINITHAFSKCGIYPFDRHKFTDEDFLPSSVTDRPCPDCEVRDITQSNAETNTVLQNQMSQIDINKDIENVPKANSPEILMTLEKDLTNKENFISPFEFRNPINAGPRQTNRKRRKPGRSMIATDTPEKDQLEQEKNTRNILKKQKVTRKIFDESSDDEEYENLTLESDGAGDNDMTDEDEKPDESSVILTDELLAKPLLRQPRAGEYIIVQLATKKYKSFFIGKVMEDRNKAFEYYVSFLTRKTGTEKFLMPENPDLSLVKDEDVKFILPKPLVVGSSSRPFYTFGVDFSSVTIK